MAHHLVTIEESQVQNSKQKAVVSRLQGSSSTRAKGPGRPATLQSALASLVKNWEEGQWEYQPTMIGMSAEERALLGQLQGFVGHLAHPAEELALDLNKVASDVQKGSFDQRVRVTGLEGTQRTVADSINQILEAVADKFEWYVAILDAVPFPIHVIDMDMKWVFLNKAFEKLMKDQKFIRTRADAVGLPCSTATANICNTEGCGIRQLTQKGISESFFDWHGTDCKQDTSKIMNHKGEHLGWVEVVQDLTAILRVKDYTKNEVDRLAKNLTQLAAGELNFSLELGKSDQFTADVEQQFQKINDSLIKVKDAVGTLIADTETLSGAAGVGRLQTRADVSKHNGEFRKAVEGVNGILDAVVSIVDAVPFPVHVIDKDMKWTFLNKAFERLMVDQGYVKDRTQAIGMPCATAKANICNTTECGIRRLERGIGDSFFDWCGMNCKQDTSYIVNMKGEKVGFVETVQDLTSTIRVKDYTNKEVTRLASNLVQIANGDLNFSLELGKSDHFTADVEQQFKKINDSLVKVKDAVGGLIGDTEELADAASLGRLQTRADLSKHNGEFRKAVEGVNGILDAVVSIVDAVPFPVHVIDKNMKWTFLNKAFEKLMVDQGYVKDRIQAIGMPCATAKANICNTTECGIRRLERGIGDSFFDWCGMNCKQDTSHIVNMKGEKVGFVETVQDLTSTIRVKDYTNKEVTRLASNLVQIANGDLAINLKLADGDEFTREVQVQFAHINDSLGKVVTAIHALTTVIWSSSGLLRISVSNCRPSISGMCQSIKTKSGWGGFTNSSSPSLPFLAIVTSKPKGTRIDRRNILIVDESSTTKAFIFRSLTLPANNLRSDISS